MDVKQDSGIKSRASKECSGLKTAFAFPANVSNEGLGLEVTDPGSGFKS